MYPDQYLELTPANLFQDEGMLVHSPNIVVETVMQDEYDLLDERTEVFVVDSPHVDHPFIVDLLLGLSWRQGGLPVHCETDP